MGEKLFNWLFDSNSVICWLCIQFAEIIICCLFLPIRSHRLGASLRLTMIPYISGPVNFAWTFISCSVLLELFSLFVLVGENATSKFNLDTNNKWQLYLIWYHFNIIHSAINRFSLSFLTCPSGVVFLSSFCIYIVKFIMLNAIGLQKSHFTRYFRHFGCTQF